MVEEEEGDQWINNLAGSSAYGIKLLPAAKEGEKVARIARWYQKKKRESLE